MAMRALALSLALLVTTAVAQIVNSDGSDLCNQSGAQCRAKCVPPQTFAFSCNEGDNFNQPTVNCMCVTPAMDSWDGGECNQRVMRKLPVRFSGRSACVPWCCALPTT